MNEEKALTKINQLENTTPSNKNGAGAAPSRTYGLPPRLVMLELHHGNQKLDLGEGTISG